MHQLESKIKALSKMDAQASKNVPVLDKKAQEWVRSRRKVNPEDVATYNDFLGTTKTGIFRLFPDNGCVTKNVVRIDPDCANFVPLSSSFSFREGAYKEDTELKFLGLAKDDRDDIIVTFRIVRKEADGNVTIVWKELNRKETPKLKFGKGESMTDINSLN
jgi:hypothetical protein